MRAKELFENAAVSNLARSMVRKRFLVLAYHGVDDADRLRSQLCAVLKWRRPVALEQVEQCLGAGRELPSDGFLVTFDDGRRSVLERGLPVLSDLGVPAALFVVAGLVGASEPFWWDEVTTRSASGGVTAVVAGSGVDLVRALKLLPDDDRRRAIEELRASSPSVESAYPHLTPAELMALDRSGVSIGSHSLTHPCLDRCDDDRVRTELKSSRDLLQEILGRSVRSIAYPNGNVDRRISDAAARAGYTVGFAFDHRLSVLRPDPMLVSRVRVDPMDPNDHFVSVVSGAHPMLHHLRGRK